MIMISRLASGALLIQKDGTELLIDAAAVPAALGPILLTLIDAGKVVAQARREAYESGLTVGYHNGVRETEARHAREAEQYADSLLSVAAMPLAA